MPILGEDCFFFILQVKEMRQRFQNNSGAHEKRILVNITPNKPLHPLFGLEDCDSGKCVHELVTTRNLADMLIAVTSILE